ncbi:hypothetical protein PBRA_006075 [Plasmodiophora brassicae]|uniref:Uncharacterized protein n=1 Tax=Plasmodiophora brassicae TaxID=37360 RepID=A0A0G4IS75_PLABS|nr:hypothetical protein PBRA_006075 [Plasmodiophora brassicae]
MPPQHIHSRHAFAVRSGIPHSCPTTSWRSGWNPLTSLGSAFQRVIPNEQGLGGRSTWGNSKESCFRIDGIQAAIWSDLHPGDVVANTLHLPAGDTRLHHCQVRLATSGWERGGKVFLDPLGIRDADNEHVLGQPSLVASHGRRDTERKALLSKQSVPTYTRHHQGLPKGVYLSICYRIHCHTTIYDVALGNASTRMGRQSSSNVETCRFLRSTSDFGPEHRAKVRLPHLGRWVCQRNA